MTNIDYWNYRSLMSIFNAEKLPKEKCFEYILLSITNFAEIFNADASDPDLSDYRNEPYELYEYLMMENLKDAHKKLPKYLDMEFDVERYKAINTHIGKINIKKAELRDSGFNIFKRLKHRFKLFSMLNKSLTVKDFIGYFFLRMLEEANVTTGDQKKLFLKNLKAEFQEFAADFPKNSTYLNL